MTIQQMLSELLSAFGFEQMSKDVLTEQDQHTLQKYARVVLRQVPEQDKRAVYSRFALLRLV